MGKNKKVIIISGMAVLTAAVIIIAACIISGRGASSRFYVETEKKKQKDIAAIKMQDNNENNGTEANNIENTQEINAFNMEGNNESGNSTADESRLDDSLYAVKEPGKENKSNEKAQKKEVKVKAVYLTGATAGSTDALDHYIELVKTTELNALVIDIKEGGVVNYESNVPEVRNNNLFTNYYNVENVINKLHDNGIYVIGRIVCFRDNGLATKRPDLAVKKLNGTLWREGSMGAWTNPHMEEVWKYNIDIAREAVEKGFDEIQFDYVRFPAVRDSEVIYGKNISSKVDAINKFLETAKKEIGKCTPAVISADVFGIICESVYDGESIGQDLETVGMNIDYICPMIYPSHYANAAPKGYMANGIGQSINGVMFTAPDLKPYDVVYQTLVKCRDRLSKVENYNARVRPYLQDFTASYLPEGYFQTYGAEQVRQQIKAVYDAGYEEWILWDGKNSYSEGAFEREDSN